VSGSAWSSVQSGTGAVDIERFDLKAAHMCRYGRVLVVVL
jgi:hypothetical protein